jgi:hypothetical protein
LDLTNRLLARKGEVFGETGCNPAPKIGLIGSMWSEDEAIEYDFQVPQYLPDEQSSATEAVSGVGTKYGFNHQYSGRFIYLQNPDILTVRDPESKTASERWEEMRRQEDEKFDRDWYSADLYDPPEQLEEIMAYTSNVGNSALTAQEQSLLRNIGNKDCKLASSFCSSDEYRY